VRFHVLTGTDMKITSLQHVVPCILLKFADVSDTRTASIISAVRISVASVYFNETTRRHIPEKSSYYDFSHLSTNICGSLLQ
jgi:hypothetical protein